MASHPIVNYWQIVLKGEVFIKKWQIQEIKSNINPLDAYARVKTKNSIFLHSAGNDSNLSKYSIITLCPEIIFKAKNSMIEITTNGKQEIFAGNPFETLNSIFEDNKLKNSYPALPTLPFIGGPVGFISYDSNKYIENLDSIAKDDLNTPDFYFIFPKVVIIFDKKEDKKYILSCDNNDLKNTLRKLEQPIVNKSFITKNLSSNMGQEYFEKAVYKIIDYIYQGDVYQVNFSQRFETSFEGDPFSLYKKLCQINPSPFSSYIETDNSSIISSSPERLIQLNGVKVQTRPIAGTRRRGQNKEEDNYLSGHLLLDEKEKAEHLMLVDLERNDIGKVCEMGSVCCDEFMTIEKYSHVIHIVSNVKGQLKKDKNEIDLLKAVFPGGTITGCPKIRCMEVIEELEPTKRGPYTGSIGYISYNGSMDFNIIIRTFIQKKNKLFFQAGAGIVSDSVPEREYYETVSKANALLKSLNISPKEIKWELMSSR